MLQADTDTTTNQRIDDALRAAMERLVEEIIDFLDVQDGDFDIEEDTDFENEAIRGSET